MNEKTVDNNFECNICNKTFGAYYKIKRHERNHTRVATYKCSICEKSFKFADNFKIHQDIHNKSAQCEICDIVLSSELHVKIHQKKMHHSVKVKQHVCDICDKSCNNADYLIKHKLTHSVQKPFQCKSCGKSYNFSSSLENHEQLHNDNSTQNKKQYTDLSTPMWTPSKHKKSTLGWRGL